jgi:hypothetical protein
MTKGACSLGGPLQRSSSISITKRERLSLFRGSVLRLRIFLCSCRRARAARVDFFSEGSRGECLPLALIHFAERAANVGLRNTSAAQQAETGHPGLPVGRPNEVLRRPLTAPRDRLCDGFSPASRRLWSGAKVLFGGAGFSRSCTPVLSIGPPALRCLFRSRHDFRPWGRGSPHPFSCFVAAGWRHRCLKGWADGDERGSRKRVLRAGKGRRLPNAPFGTGLRFSFASALLGESELAERIRPRRILPRGACTQVRLYARRLWESIRGS